MFNVINDEIGNSIQDLKRIGVVGLICASIYIGVKTLLLNVQQRTVVCVRFCHEHTPIQSDTVNWQN
jgi:hypothetical protein